MRDHFKIIRAEGSDGQTGFRIEIANGIVRPSVANGDGRCDVGAGDPDGICTGDFSVSDVPDFVRATDRESDGPGDVKRTQAAAEAIERDSGFVPADRKIFKLGTAVGELHAVVLGEWPATDGLNHFIRRPPLHDRQRQK